MEQKTALITGATSGIGIAIASHLASQQYALIILGRDNAKLNKLEEELKQKHAAVQIQKINCNMASLESIEQACDIILSNKNVTLDVMILNAGIWNFEFKKTIDQIEETLQVNVIAPILLFEKLQHLLSNNAKVLFTSSGLHQGEIQFKNIEFNHNFSGFKAYRQSKLALILLARLFANQKNSKQINYYSVHPGMVNTQLGRNAGVFAKFIFKLFGKSIEEGAKTHCFLIDQPAESLEQGAFYASCKPVKTTRYSYDMNVAEKLYNVVKNYCKM